MAAEKDIKDLELKKHVGSIHCSNTLSLLQRKISNVLLYHAYPELKDRDEHEITIKSLCELIGYSSHDYESIKKALKALISTVIEWNLLGDSKTHSEDWNASSILSSVGIKGGVCTYSYSTRLKKLLYMPEIYGRINIAIQARFKSNYALALYENCIRYRNLPFTRWFALSTFRKLMGVPEEKYTIFRDFKRRVLDKSVAEINAFSDLIIVPEIEREGHKVQRIRFKLSQRESEEVSQYSPEIDGEKKNLLIELIDFGLDNTQAQKLFDEYEIYFIKEKMAIIKSSRAYVQDKVQNMAAYLKSALRENYKIPKRRTMNRLQNEKKEEDLELLKKEYSEFLNSKIDEAFEKLEHSIQLTLYQSFEKHLQQHNNKFVLEKYYNKGFSNRIVKSMFRTFLRKEHASFLPPIENIEDYLERKKMTVLN